MDAYLLYKIMALKRASFDWNHARAFLVTAEEGSLSAAARILHLTQPTLSRQVASLEKSLGVTLFERTPRELLLTKSGRELLEHCKSMEDSANLISLSATGLSQSVSGHVLISATTMMATHFLPPALKRLEAVAPNLGVEIVASNEIADLRRRESDIAIRHTRPSDASLIAKRLPDTIAGFFASSSYLDLVGRPRNMADAESITFVGFDDVERRIPLLASLGLKLTKDNFNFSTGSATLALELVRQGFGIGLLPLKVAESYPELEAVLTSCTPFKIETWLVAHRELKTNPGIRIAFDILAESVGKT